MAKATIAFKPQDARFEAFALNVGDHIDDPHEAAAIVRRALRTPEVKAILGTQPQKWTITRLSPNSYDYLVSPKTINVTPAQAWEVTRTLRRHRDIADAEPLFRMPNLDGLQPEKGKLAGALLFGKEKHLPGSAVYEWSLSKCFVREAWTASVASGQPDQGAGIRIAHPDTGYTDHSEFYFPTLVLNKEGYNFEDDKQDPWDPLNGRYPGHGTATGSVIMSDEGDPTSPTAFVSGVAPKASLIPIRVNNSVIHLSYRNLIQALYFAVDVAKCHVISMSLGGPLPSRFLHRALQHAVTNGVIPIAAAGNQVGFVVYPARYDEVIGVAASNAADGIWSGSSGGADVDVTAPGESVWRALIDKNGKRSIERSSGTSYAAAITAGLCALWLAHHGRDALIARYGVTRLFKVFKEILMRSVRCPNGWQTGQYGPGIEQAQALLAMPLPTYAPAAALRDFRVGVSPRRANDFDWIASYFPSVERGRLRQALIHMLHTTDGQLELTLSQVGDEFAYHFLVDPQVYEYIKRESSGKTGSLASYRSNTKGVKISRPPLKRASPTLRARVAA